MMRLKRSGLAAALLLAAAPAKSEDIVITKFRAACAGNPFAIGVDGGCFKRAGVDITGIISGAGTSVRNVIASALGYGEVDWSKIADATYLPKDLQ